jgi:LysM repeat protein
MEPRGSEARPQSRKPSSWTARILAPLALVIVAGAIVVVVGSSLDSSDDGKRDERETTASSGCKADAENAVEDGYYVIEAGEDLSIVADRTCIPIERLIRLNENLDPQLIQVGSCVDLRFEGCKVLAEGG